MTPGKFDKVATESFGAVLRPHGFTTSGSKYCTHHRKISDEIYHVILPDLGTRGVWYDVKVFATSPFIEPLFDELFPDEIGIPSDAFSYLDSTNGVGPWQEQYHCKTEEGFRRDFESRVQSALLQHALPFLDAIRSVQELVPHIKNKLYLGYAMFHIGAVAEAKQILAHEKERLHRADPGDRKVRAALQRIDLVLAA